MPMPMSDTLPNREELLSTHTSEVWVIKGNRHKPKMHINYIVLFRMPCDNGDRLAKLNLPSSQARN